MLRLTLGAVTGQEDPCRPHQGGVLPASLAASFRPRMSEEKALEGEVEASEREEGESRAVGERAGGQSKEKMPPPVSASSVPVPPTKPDSGTSILAHKIWIGNLDKRLTE